MGAGGEAFAGVRAEGSVSGNIGGVGGKAGGSVGAGIGITGKYTNELSPN